MKTFGYCIKYKKQEEIPDDVFFRYSENSHNAEELLNYLVEYARQDMKALCNRFRLRLRISQNDYNSIIKDCTKDDKINWHGVYGALDEVWCGQVEAKKFPPEEDTFNEPDKPRWKP